ncbi:MAG: energy transducer TonB [Desulfosudaceae bacterium]
MRNKLLWHNTEQRPFLVYVGVSFAFHAMVLTMMLVMSGFSGCEKETAADDVIRVDLVSFQDSGSEAGPIATDNGSVSSTAPSRDPGRDKTAAKKPVFKKPAHIPEPVVSVSEKKSPADKKSALKKETFDSEEIVSKSLDRLKQQVDKGEDPDSSFTKALSRLREEVEDRPRQVRVSGQDDGRGDARGDGRGDARVDGNGGDGNGGGGNNLSPIDIYKLELRYHILENWVYSEQLAGKAEDLKTTLGITIAEDGSITDVWYDERSGNRYFDESVYKAVLKSDPLPALPQGYSDYTVGLEFTPSDALTGRGR